jgi:hypothetical protein
MIKDIIRNTQTCPEKSEEEKEKEKSRLRVLKNCLNKANRLSALQQLQNHEKLRDQLITIGLGSTLAKRGEELYKIDTGKPTPGFGPLLAIGVSIGSVGLAINALRERDRIIQIANLKIQDCVDDYNLSKI